MRQALANLLLIAAILLMPFGMSAPASAATHHVPAASAAMEHCSENGTADQRQSGVDDCTLACAAALPAVVAPGGPLLEFRAAPGLRMLSEPLTGLHPETATPPPRRA